MRATITIDDDLLTKAQRLAAERSVLVDIVVLDLLRKSLMRTTTVRVDNGFPVFNIPPGAPPTTVDDVRRADEDVRCRSSCWM